MHVLIFAWFPPKADAETRLQVPVVYLGGEERVVCARERDEEGKMRPEGCGNEFP